MVKSKINQILQEKVFPKIHDHFIEKGFKYRKGIRGFVKKENEIEHTVYIYNDYEIFFNLSMNLDEDDLYLVFKIYFESELYKFEKWYRQNFKSGATRLNTFHEALQLCIPLKEDVDFVIPDDFDKNQKTYIGERQYFIKKDLGGVYTFNDFGTDIEILDFNINKDLIYKTLENQLNTVYDYKQMALENDKYFKYRALLIYDNQLEIPTEYVKKHTDFLISELATSEKDFNENVKTSEAIDYFVDIGEKFLNIKLSNPYKDTYKKNLDFIENQNQVIDINETLQYKEYLRVDCSKVQRYNYTLNTSGVLLIYFEKVEAESEICIIDKNGIVVQKEFPVQNRHVTMGHVKNSKSFHLFNYTIDREGNFNELFKVKKNESPFLSMIEETKNGYVINRGDRILMNDKEIRPAKKYGRIIHYDLEKEILYCFSDSKKILSMQNYHGEVLNEMKLPRKTSDVFVVNEKIFAKDTLGNKIYSLDIENGKKKLIQNLEKYPSSIQEFNKSTDIVLYNFRYSIPKIEFYTKDFKKLKFTFENEKEKYIYPMHGGEFIIIQDREFNNLIVFKKKSKSIT